jgi:hypothetical protein
LEASAAKAVTLNEAAAAAKIRWREERRVIMAGYEVLIYEVGVKLGLGDKSCGHIRHFEIIS